MQRLTLLAQFPALIIAVSGVMDAVIDDAVPPDQATELGAVHWLRDLDQGLAYANKSGKPAFLLFQEVPGCDGCVNFGRAPLSHPLMVEAIEDLFVPIAIHNNKDGADAAALKRFNEPSWNYPVVRFVNGQGKDLLPRKDGVFNTGRLATRMIAAMEKSDREAPAYLKLIAAESSDEPREKATFAMHCFWEGEAHLGAVDGVLATRVGWRERHEVVEVVFDPVVIPYEKLVEQAQQAQCATVVYAESRPQLEVARRLVGDRAKMTRMPTRDTEPDDRKYALSRTPMRWLPLTPMQATKVNAALRLGTDANRWLSPRQVKLLERIEAALKDDEKSLAELTRPEAIAELPKYEAQLRSRLTPLKASASVSP